MCLLPLPKNQLELAQMANLFLIDQISSYVKRVSICKSKYNLIRPKILYKYTSSKIKLKQILICFIFLQGISHMKWENHNYFLSWREPWHKFEDWDWFNGRNFCRDRCMDLVSFDTPEEFRIFAAIMKQGIIIFFCYI